MQFAQSTSGRASLGGVSKFPVGQRNQLSLYRTPPSLEITLDEFEEFALERLSLLRGIEQMKARGFDGDELRDKINTLQNKHMPLRAKETTTASLGAGNELLTRDVTSHFILRLAYCRTEDLRRWFLEHESLLLKHRVDTLQRNDLATFMAENKMDYEEVSNDEKRAKREKLVGLCAVTDQNFHDDATKYYKVPFTRALSLLRNRSVYVEKGIAYVPLSRLVSIIVSTFRASLSKGLVEASHMFDRTVAVDQRIAPLLKNMNKQYTGKDFSKSEGAVETLTADKVDAAAESNMPLCMKNLHMALKKEHKLKHFGRLQYGLFLKGAGMELNDAAMFWEMHFGKLMGHDEFIKKYLYNIQHMYGKVGGRKSYTPYSCNKIIMGEAPNQGHYHGCPYRHMGDTSLANMLQGLKLSSKDTTSIVKLKQDGHFQLACQKHFDVTHPAHASMDIGDGAYSNHPNQWFQASVRFHKVKAGVSLDAVAHTAVTAGVDSQSQQSQQSQQS